MEKPIGSREQKALSRLLKQIRTSQRVSQVELAQRLQEPQSFVSRYERGQQRLDVLELRQICLALGISLSDFCRRFERLLHDT